MPPDSLVITGVVCPFCGQTIQKVFARMRTPVANSHRVDASGSKNCRVVVVIDPKGDQHQVHRVPDGITDRTVMQRLMETIMRAA